MQYDIKYHITILKGQAGFTQYTTEDGLSDNYITSLEDVSGKIWIGTRVGGINICDRAEFSRYTESVGGSYNVAEDDNGNIWIGTIRGLSMWDGNRFANYTTEQGLSHYNTIVLLKDREGNIWIGSQAGGVSMWDGSGFTQYSTTEGLLGNWVFGFLEDRNGNIWIGTIGGVSMWDPAEDALASTLV